MKRTIIVLAVILVSINSCQKNGRRWTYGSEIQFGTKSSAFTKAAYAGADGKYTVGSSTYERIDWVAGDAIRIWCSQASAPDCHWADYEVNDDVTSSNRYSNATVSATGDALAWGSGDHIFYAVYPAPESSGTVTKSLSADGAVSACIGAVQAPASCSATDGNYIAVADLKANMVMSAKEVVSESDASGDFSNVATLEFYPVTTALEFTITNKTGDVLDVDYVELESAEHPLNGNFTFTIVDGIPSDCAFSGTATSDNRSVRMYFDDVALAVDETLQFTLFLLPETSVDDLTFKITDTDGKMRFAALRKADGSAIAFSNHKKTYLTGIFVPEGSVWQMKLNGSDIVSWTTGDVSDIYMEKK